MTGRCPRDTGTIIRIDTFGLCGAGKSTLFKALAPRIEARVGPGRIEIEPPVQPAVASYRLELARLMAKLALQSPSDLLSWWRGEASVWLVKKLAYRLAGIRSRPRCGSSLQIDSGLLQPFVSFAIEINRERRCYPLDSLLRIVPMPTFALYVQSSPEVAFTRYMDRGPRITEAPEILRERFDDGLRVCDLLHNTCEQYGTNVAVIDVNNEVDEQVLDRAVTEILTHPGIRVGHDLV